MSAPSAGTAPISARAPVHERPHPERGEQAFARAGDDGAAAPMMPAHAQRRVQQTHAALSQASSFERQDHDERVEHPLDERAQPEHRHDHARPAIGPHVPEAHGELDEDRRVLPVGFGRGVGPDTREQRGADPSRPASAT
jgi:hypothetical protein